MKTVITTLNAKYIHRSLAVRLLYVATRVRGDVRFAEFSIKESVEVVAQKLVAGDTKVVAIGVYIWNVDRVRELAGELKRLNPQIIIILGGPEVSYEPAFFLDRWPVDYVISGEGEFVLGELLAQIEHGGEGAMVTGVSTVGRISNTVMQADIERVVELDSPYMLSEDVGELGTRIVYFETSRGCPYQCQYCLSSLERGVRYFPLEYIFRNLKYLIDNGARQIKFLDRTFNLNRSRTRAIFDFLIANHRDGLVCQFEIYADLMSLSDIEYLNATVPTGYFRFEIGIQSTHTPTNEAVKRQQDFSKISTNIRSLLAGGRIDLHLDLLAGLPHETFELFTHSFNSVFAFGAKELQLGFLKMLRGTALRNNAGEHGYRFSPDAPYQIENNHYISATELERIHAAEHALEKLWNSGRFSRTMNAVFEGAFEGRYFDFFDRFGAWYSAENLPHRGYQLEELFRWVERFLASQNIDLGCDLMYDYHDCFPLCPRQTFALPIDKQLKKRILNRISVDSKFLETNQLTPDTIRNHTSLFVCGQDDFRLAVYGEHRGKPRFILLDNSKIITFEKKYQI